MGKKTFSLQSQQTTDNVPNITETTNSILCARREQYVSILVQQSNTTCSRSRSCLFPSKVDNDDDEFHKLMAVLKPDARLNSTTIPPSTLHQAVLNSPKVDTFSTIAAQQAQPGVYSLLLTFRATNSVVRMKCGHGVPACNATCTPSQTSPILCSSKGLAHSHTSNDMQPVLFTVIPAHTTEDCSPATPLGTVIPSAITIGRDVSLVYISVHMYWLLYPCIYVCFWFCFLFCLQLLMSWIHLYPCYSRQMLCMMLRTKVPCPIVVILSTWSPNLISRRTLLPTYFLFPLRYIIITQRSL